MSKSKRGSNLTESKPEDYKATQTLINLKSTSRNLINLNEKIHSHPKKRTSHKSSTTLLEKKTTEYKEKLSEAQIFIQKSSSATQLARLLSLKSDTEKNINPKDKIKEYVKYALHGIRNPFQNNMPKLKRGQSMGSFKKAENFKKPDQMIKEWSEEKSKQKFIKDVLKTEKLQKLPSFSSSSSDSEKSHIKIETINQDKENISNSNLNSSLASQKSSIFERFGNVSNFIAKIFTKDNLRSSVLRKSNNNNADYNRNDCIYYKILRQRQKEVIKKEINIICDDQNRLNLSKPLLEKWLRVKYKVKFAIRVNKFNSDIKVFGSSANVGTEINNKYFVSKIYSKQRTLTKKLDPSIKKAKNIMNIKGIIYPGNIFMTYWSLVVIFLLLYTATITPYRVTFIDISDKNWTIIDWLVDALFMTDIVVTLNLAYTDEDGKTVNNRFKIFYHYLKSWLIIDIIGIFPFQFLDNSNTDETTNDVGGYNDFVKMLRLPRLYRLMKLTRLYKILNRREGLNILISIQNILKLKSSFVKIIKFLFMVIVFVHLMGCFWHFEAKLQNFEPKTWVYE